jgi:hypothetical protein
MSEVEDLMEKAVVGRFCRKSVSPASLKGWLEVNWETLLGYIHVYHVLVRSWISFIFHSKEDMDKVLSLDWRWGHLDWS